jgi:homoserine dehydrogenase
VTRIDEAIRDSNVPGGQLRVLLVGAGSLGRAFLRRLSTESSRWPIKLVGVVTGHHGRRFEPEGLAPEQALGLLEADNLGNDGPSDPRKILELVRPDAIVECVPQNIRSGEPSLTYLRAALDLGVHAVTANKSAIALGYRDLRHRAAKSAVTFRFEPTVLDGLPIFTFMGTLPAVDVRRVRGVLNGTSSLVLESVQLGSTRSRGLARAQAQGIAEADAVLDLDGWDAAAKAALLANVWMGGALRVVDVVREGCEAIKDDELRRSGDKVSYRLVADVSRASDGTVKASVRPTAIEPNDPFFSLKGAAGGIVIETSGGNMCFLQGGHGLDDAAFGLLLDCYSIFNKAPQV